MRRYGDSTMKADGLFIKIIYNIFVLTSSIRDRYDCLLRDAYHEMAQDVGFFYAAYALLGFAWAILFLEPDEDYSNSKFYAKADIAKIPKLTRFLVVTYIACFFLFLGMLLLYVIFE